MKFLDGLSGKKKGILLAAIGILGVLLILWGTFGEKETEEASEKTGENLTTLEYIDQLENKIGNIAKQITGSNEVRVIVSVSTGTEYIYVSNEKLRHPHRKKSFRI